ncbi:phosphatidylserine decarboxylase-domain-containing protein [Pisolithus orientalis]|uniref:phosphatidylserine decarboxylase-domain-containing protein n=1 Tax=Pisolithus orientalis TaxID=936130 RepID=UPI002224BBE8|nr:phosphatidylserine decarboxylase-domain-containing protein [Pisolithus orientalis]KAI6010719.1 phosphatidylserine decarboxylase-domain-containing protein [Pisolithus orientalis]
MSSLEEVEIVKPIENIHPNNLQRVQKEVVIHAFRQLVEHSHPSKGKGNVTTTVHAFAHSRVEWLHKVVPELETLAEKYHIGNFVAIRGTNQRFFESMPIYARLGMHLLFYGKEQVKLLEGNKLVEDTLREQSIHQGKIYDSPESAKNIPSFIKMYNIQLDELLEPDIHKYHTFNEFFSRKLKPGARPVENWYTRPLASQRSFGSRETNSLYHRSWVSIPPILSAKQLSGGSLAIFRLAPADYHRFHSPVDGRVLTEHRDIPGEYYTVNPQAVNEPNLDVFTRNKRSVLLLEHEVSKKPIAIVAVGALLVGSIVWTYNNEIKRGDEVGYFAYGGSTVIAVFPPGLIQFDEDLVLNSTGKSVAANGQGSIETLVKVGYSLGKMPDTVE